MSNNDTSGILRECIANFAFWMIVILLACSVSGDTGLGTSRIQQLRANQQPLDRTNQEQELWDLWAGNVTADGNVTTLDTEHFFGVLQGLTSTWKPEQKAATLPDDFNGVNAPLYTAMDISQLPSLNVVVADTYYNETDKMQSDWNNSIPEEEGLLSDGWPAMMMLYNFSTSFSTMTNSSQNRDRQAYFDNAQSVNDQQMTTALLKANALDQTGEAEESIDVGEDIGEDDNVTTVLQAPVLPMPGFVQQQQSTNDDQQQQYQSPSPAQTSGLPFPVPSDAVPIPSAPAPDFGSIQSLLSSVPDSFRSIQSMGTALPLPSDAPSPIASQSAQQQGQGQQSSVDNNNPFLYGPSQQQSSQLQQQQTQIGTQTSTTAATPSYSSSSCSGRSDQPGPGTQCGCSNVVPEGSCACAQVFFMQQCDNPDVSTPNELVPYGYCDVTCGRCSCCPSVYEQAKNLNLTVFTEILDKISMDSGGGMGGGKSITDSLKNPSHKSTVFIPTDEAFRQLYEEEYGQTKAEFLSKAPPLYQIAQTHVLLSLYAATAEELLAGELGTTLATQYPTAYLTLSDEDSTIEGMVIQAPGSDAHIVRPDVNGCHSSIHIIDQVLLSYEPENKYS